MIATLHIVDDDDDVRDSLELMLSTRGFRTRGYRDAAAFLAAAPLEGRACAVIDIRMPGMDGLALQAEMLRRGMELPVIVVTGHADVPLAVEAMKSGAADFVEKPYSLERMLIAIEAAARMASGPVMDAKSEQALASLSRREREVLTGLLAGKQNKAIARDLCLSPRTIEVYRANMMEKLGAQTLSQALRVALACGMQPTV
jgi:two-component system response regulator FixJ